MGRKAGVGLLVAAVATVGVLLALSLAAGPPPSRTMTLEELRAFADLELGGVRFRQTYFLDEAQIDGGTTVAFLISFPDGVSENVSFVYRTFLCSDRTVTSAHLGPQAAFFTYCDTSSVLVALL